MLNTTSEEDVVRDLWQNVRQQAPPAVRAHVAGLVEQQHGWLSALFYREMMAVPQASPMLDHATVDARLKASLARWLRELFAPASNVDAWMSTQRRTGEAHARIGVPINLMARGAQALQRGLAQLLGQAEAPGVCRTDAVQYVYEMIDVAIHAMNHAYASSARRIERTDEAYRLLFLGRDLRAERERQRSQLLEWAHQILVRCYWGPQPEPAAADQDFADSPFGLWMKHKASVLFDGAPEITTIGQHIREIEQQWLPRLSQAREQPDQAREVVAAINSLVEKVKALLGVMFDRCMAGQDGRDTLTQLLNRRYLPTIVRREIELAQRSPNAFALLLVDIDHFARLRAAPDAAVADHAVTLVAETLLEAVRAGDFVFRLGEDRFGVLLVDTHRVDVLPVADALRQRVAALTLGPGALHTGVTVSIGVALFDAHPDYQRLLERAELALNEAKAQGRDRCIQAG